MLVRENTYQFDPKDSKLDYLYNLASKISSISKGANIMDVAGYMANPDLQAELSKLSRFKYEYSKVACNLVKPVEPVYAFNIRESVRDFSTQDLTIEQLGEVLSSYVPAKLVGIEDRKFRHNAYVPSAGALYGLDVFCASVDCKNETITAPLWLNIDDLTLQSTIKDNTCVWSDLSINPSGLSGASYVIWIVGNYGRIRAKYGLRSYRLLHIEAGGLVTAMSIIAANIGVGTYIATEFIDSAVERFLGCDGLNESLITSLVLGIPSK